MKTSVFIIGLLCCYSPFLWADSIVFHVGKVIPIDGPELTDAWVWVENGKIKKIGKNLDIPWDAKVIEALDKTVFPGMVEASSSGSLDSPNENIPLVPFVSVRESLNPTHVYFEDLIRNGITTVQIIQGPNTIIGGYGAVLKPTGNTLESMLRKEPGMLRISLAADGKNSRIRKMATLRRLFQETLHYQKELKEKKLSASDTPPKEELPLSPELYLESADFQKQPIIDLFEGRLQALIYCPEPGDCLRALELAQTYKFKPILEVGPRAFLAVDFLKKAGISVILDSEITYQEDFQEEDVFETIAVPNQFHQKQVPFCLSSRGAQFLWYQAGLAVQNGLPREEALKSITLYPAKILGIEKQVGSLSEGKDADFLLLSGDPLDVRTWIEEVWIEGKQVYTRKEDLRLKHFSGQASPK